MVVEWPQSYRIIHSRYPFVGIFDRIARPEDIDRVLALEERTNDRILDDAGVLSLVRSKDRVVGAGTTPIMAAFTHTRPNRFSDGSFGVYYATQHLASAVAESRFHTQAFYRATNEPSADIDMRVYSARITGRFDDLLARRASDPLLDPNSYLSSQAYGRSIYEADHLDGVVYPSVRDEQHRAAVACLRPRVVSDCYPHSYLLYRWDGTYQKIVDVVVRETLGGL